MKKRLLGELILLIIICLVMPYPIYSAGESTKGTEKVVQTVGEKIEQGSKGLETAVKKADEKIGPKIREADAGTTKAVKNAHERAMQRAAWLRRKAAQLQAEAERIEARVNAAIKREQERLDENARKFVK